LKSKPTPLDVLDPMPFGIYAGQLVGTVIEEDADYMRRLTAVNENIDLNEAAQKYLEDNLRS